MELFPGSFYKEEDSFSLNYIFTFSCLADTVDVGSIEFSASRGCIVAA